MSDIAAAEHKASKALTAVRDLLAKKYPVGSEVMVKIRSGQKKLTPAVVVAHWAFDLGNVRVRLQTKKQDVRNVHWCNIR